MLGGVARCAAFTATNRFERGADWTIRGLARAAGTVCDDLAGADIAGAEVYGGMEAGCTELDIKATWDCRESRPGGL
ncbi:MAG: hypothetical protein JO036_06275 [Candidatus Eremiobacteraeota bacterium]|nr:hypothetical protein [Candidatus Eremiobacteraeota bacterium]